jgi:hypothetical protein
VGVQAKFGEHQPTEPAAEEAGSPQPRSPVNTPSARRVTNLVAEYS